MDGLRVWDMETEVLNDRKLLSRDGILVVTVALSKATGRVLGRPQVISSGFLDADERDRTTEETADLVLESLNQSQDGPLEEGFVTKRVRDTVGKFLHARTGRRPMIVPVVVEV